MSGLFGIYSKEPVKADMVYGMYAIQHRGQEFMSIVNIDEDQIHSVRREGTISDNVNDILSLDMPGNIGIGYVRNANFPNRYKYQLPLSFPDNSVLAIEGRITNEDFTLEELHDFLVGDEMELVEYVASLEGAFSILFVKGERMIAIRDRNGVKPISVGRRDEDYIVSSETCVFDSLGGEHYKDLIGGEILIIDQGKLKSLYAGAKEHKLCMFEMIYVQRPDSVVEGVSVYDARYRSGQALYNEFKTEGDIVIGAPESGIIAAHGYAEASNIPFRSGLIKNRYVGRTYIKPTEATRKMNVRLKLNPIKEVIQGKNVILVDDSIIRGTTIKRIVEILRSAGAKTIHVRVASPQVVRSDNLSMEIPDESTLIAYNRTTEEIRELIGADSLHFLTIDGLRESCGNRGYYEKYFGVIE